MVPQQNSEDWDVADDDPNFTRIKYVGVCCPFPDECNADCWKRAKAWSYEGPLAVRCYTARHLMESSKHYKQKDLAIEAVAELEIEELEETFNDREEYRRGLEAAARQRGSAKPAPPAGPPPPSRRTEATGGGLVCIKTSTIPFVPRLLLV